MRAAVLIAICVAVEAGSIRGKVDKPDDWVWPEEKPKLGCITLDDDSFTSWGCIVNSQGRKVCSIVSHGTETSTQCRAHCTSAPAERDTWAWPEEEPKLGCITLDDDSFVHWACVTGSTGRKSCQYVSGGAPTGTSAECRATCGKSEAENVFTAKANIRTQIGAITDLITRAVDRVSNKNETQFDKLTHRNLVQQYNEAFMNKNMLSATPGSDLEKIWEEHATWTKSYAQNLKTVGASFADMQPSAYHAGDTQGDTQGAHITINGKSFTVPSPELLGTKMNWSRDQVARAVKGYGQFVQALLPGKGKFTIVPSLVVDEVWHHHIRHSKHYQQMVDMFGLGGSDGEWAPSVASTDSVLDPYIA
jgi:hypothetical protein